MKFLLPISFILVAGGLFFGVVNPMYSGDGGVMQLRNDVAIYNKALANSTELQKTLDSLVEKYKNIKPEDKDRLEHFLPNTVNNIKFILEIEHAANLHSMPLKNIKFDAEQTDAAQNKPGSIVVDNPSDSRSYGVFPIEFTTEGDYPTFVAFLKDIEHNLRLVDVKSVSFIVPPPSVKPGDTGSNIYSYTLQVQTYWLK